MCKELIKKVHSVTHIWQLPRLPVSLSDEAGEAALRMDARMARVSSTQADSAVKDILLNDLYRLQHPQRMRSGKTFFWIGNVSNILETLAERTPQLRPIVVENCILQQAILCINCSIVKCPSLLFNTEGSTKRKLIIEFLRQM